MAFLVLLISVAIGANPGEVQGSRCWRSLGRLDYYGSAEQVKQLQQMTKSRGAAECPRVGFGFSTRERSALLAYDRASGILIRVAIWDEGNVDAERWSEVSDASLQRDDPDDGFDQPTYQPNNVARESIPAALRAFARRYGGRVGARVP